MTSILQRIIKHRDLIAKATLIDLKKRHAGSVLGLGWFVFSPLILLSVYSVVYLFIFKMQPGGLGRIDYVLYIFSGLVPFMCMSEGITSGLISLMGESSLLKSNVFPIEIIPVKAVLTSLPAFLVGVFLVLFSACIYGHCKLVLLFLPIIYFCQIIFVIGLSWIFSLVNLMLKDLQQIISYALMVAMIASPIAYTSDMLPQKLKILLWANPFAYFVQASQEIIVLGRMPKTSEILIIVVVSLFTFWIGNRFFSLLRGHVLEFY